MNWLRARTALGGLIAATALAAQSTAPVSAVVEITVDGTVACRGGHRVAGVWVELSNGGGAWASLSIRTVGDWVADFSVKLNVPSTPYPVQLHIGCGTTSSGSWWSNNRTDFKSMPNGYFNVICKEAPGTASGRCKDWGSRVLIGMPFTGGWALNGTHPSSHPTSGDWSTDLYGLTKSVKLKTFAPRGVLVERKVTSTPSATCTKNGVAAGKNVVVNIIRNGVNIGYVKYGHLVSTTSASTTSKPNDTVLGKTAGWPTPWPNDMGSDCWKVSQSSGVHTHVTLKNTSSTQRACFANWGSSGVSSLPAGRWIGSLGTSGVTSKQKACP